MAGDLLGDGQVQVAEMAMTDVRLLQAVGRRYCVHM
jgi:hypothetical protein